jgi:predicted ribosome quality control (RQC) complex YloA/Tae2 family protein
MLARQVVDGHVQKVRVTRLGAREVALLELRVPGETRHVVVAEGLGVGVLGAEDRGRLKGAMGGAGAGAGTGKGAGVKPGEARARELAETAVRGLEGTDDELRARGAAIVEQIVRETAGARQEELRRAVAKAIARVERRVVAVRGDLERAEGADAMAQRAQLFVVEASRTRRGATELVAVDWASGEAVEVRMALDPAKGAREQIDALFRRARRLKEGARIGRERLAEAEGALSALRAVATELTGGPAAAAAAAGMEALEAAKPAAPGAPGDPLAALAARARRAAPRDFKLAASPTPARTHASASAPAHGPRARARPQQPPLPPYRTFVTASGARVLVGRGADRNDALTFHVARPHDLWLHAKNRTGAHVVVPLDRSSTCPSEVLVDAAHLAAHFSEARDEAVVEVQYTPRRYLRKPKGSAPGLVVVDREKVLVLRREEGRLRALLERETE